MSGSHETMHLHGQLIKPDADCRCTIDILIAMLYQACKVAATFSQVDMLFVHFM